MTGDDIRRGCSVRSGYHALVELVLYVIRFAACNLETAQSFLDVFQQVLDMCQLAVEICRSLEFHELCRHLSIVFLSRHICNQWTMQSVKADLGKTYDRNTSCKRHMDVCVLFIYLRFANKCNGNTKTRVGTDGYTTLQHELRIPNDVGLYKNKVSKTQKNEH